MKIMPVLALLIFTSCAMQRFDLVEGKKKSVPSYEGKHHFIFWGLGQEKKIDPNEVCEKDEKLSSVDTHLTFVDGLLSGITWGIYYPRSYSVFCSKE